MTLRRIKKPTTRKGKKYLENRGPKIIENTKQALFVHGRKTSEIINNCLTDLYHLKKPDALNLSGKLDLLPFEDQTPLETASNKFDSSLFFFGSHTKKRPNNLVIGRMFDGHVLDMVELGIERYQSLAEFHVEKIPLGIKPCLVFAGPGFDTDPTLVRVKNLLIDLFRREDVNSVRLQGLEHVLSFTEADGRIFMRSYKTLLKKSGTRMPRVELEEIGPSGDLFVRRTKLASDDLFKTACKQPTELKAKTVKNIRRDAFGTKLGRVHMKQDDIKRLQTRKMKGLRKPRGKKGRPPTKGRK